jgi:hypothetical protein
VEPTEILSADSKPWYDTPLSGISEDLQGSYDAYLLGPAPTPREVAPTVENLIGGHDSSRARIAYAASLLTGKEVQLPEDGCLDELTFCIIRERLAEIKRSAQG